MAKRTSKNRGRRGYAQVSGFRRYLRRFPDEVREPIRLAIDATCQRIVKEARNRAPVRTGKLQASITFKIGRDGLTAQVGILGKRAQRRAYYGAFVEFGTKGYMAGMRRATAGSKTTKVMRRKVSRQNARPYFFPSVDGEREPHRKRVSAALQQTLARMERF